MSNIKNLFMEVLNKKFTIGDALFVISFGCFVFGLVYAIHDFNVQLNLLKVSSSKEILQLKQTVLELEEQLDILSDLEKQINDLKTFPEESASTKPKEDVFSRKFTLSDSTKEFLIKGSVVIVGVIVLGIVAPKFLPDSINPVVWGYNKMLPQNYREYISDTVPFMRNVVEIQQIDSVNGINWFVKTINNRTVELHIGLLDGSEKILTVAEYLDTIRHVHPGTNTVVTQSSVKNLDSFVSSNAPSLAHRLNYGKY